MSKKILVIADTQVKPGVDTSHIKALGNYIVHKRPDIIVNIGDWFDFESLSSYDKGKRSFEGRRFKDDLIAGHDAMRCLMRPLWELQNRQRSNRKKVYTPEMHFTIGNHEDRADRFANDHPEMTGVIGTDVLDLEKYGWAVHPFLKPVEMEGIFFVHYLANPMSGKPYGGTAMNILKTVGKSFVVGHKQVLDVAIRPTIDGKMQLGIVNGAFYSHDEGYKGPQGNNHFRGVTMLHEVDDGFALPMFVSLDYLVKKYN